MWTTHCFGCPPVTERSPGRNTRSWTRGPMESSEERKQFAIQKLNALPFAKLVGMRLVDIRPNEAVIEIEMRDDLRQPSGVLHGGVTATLIDTAMAFAVRTYLTDTEPTATIDLTVHFLRPHVAGKASCTA